jgi:hypothetical protein
MAAVDYDLQVSFNPENPVPGEWVETTVNLSRVSGAVENLYAAVVGYGISVTFNRSGENTFTARTFVPWEADPGRYVVTFWGADADGKAGPRVDIPVTIKAR